MTGISTIDRFAVLDHLADGSFGAIHLGKDTTTDQQVVIKLCEVEDQGLRQRFFTEAEMAAKLNHTHVVDVLAAGFHGETPYLVQEYLEGYDLEEIITQRRTWRGTDKLAVLMHVAQGMAYAHSLGVSHHDLKPANVRISGGVAKVMDFGTSRLASTETHTTQRGVTLATASYLPPEQVRSGDLDHRVDVFAFGSLAYELFTYQRPFRGQTLSALVYQILYKDPVPMASVWPDCPAPLNKLLTTCLSKDRELRYAGFPQVLAVLQSLHDDAAAGKHPALTVAVTALPAPEPVEDVMSQSMVTRTAASVAEGPMTSAAATQRIMQGGGPPEPPAAKPSSTEEVSSSQADAAKGSSAETIRITALPDEDAVVDQGAGSEAAASEDATVILGKAPAGYPPPRPKVGATTRTEQPPEIPERPKVGATTRSEQPPAVPESPRVGATTRSKQPALPSSENEAPAPPEPPPTTVADVAPGKHTATRHVEPDAGAPAATRPTVQRPEAPETESKENPPPLTPPKSGTPKDDTPESDPSTNRPINTGKLALSAQEISALVAQGKLEEAQQHLQAMQQGTADPAELPTTAMQRATDTSSEVAGLEAATPPATAPGAPPGPPPTLPKPDDAPPPFPAEPSPSTKAESSPSSTPPSESSRSTAPPAKAPPSPGSAPPASPATSRDASPKAPSKAPSKAPASQPPVPGQKTLDRSSAPPSPASTKKRGGPPVALLAGLGIAALLLVAAAGWWFFGRSQPEAPTPVVEVPRPQPAPPSPVGEVVQTGQVLVDASPWGTLTEITDGSGYLVDLPVDNVTPMVLNLPEGTYNLVLSRGTEAAETVDETASEGLDGEALGELQSCEVEVTLDLPATCRVRFAPPSVTDYFKDAGWWQ